MLIHIFGKVQVIIVAVVVVWGDIFDIEFLFLFIYPFF